MSTKTITLESPVIRRLFAAEMLLAKAAEPFGLKIRICTPVMRIKLPNVSEARLLRAAENLEMTASVLFECAEQRVDPKDDLLFFKLSMRALGASFPADFLAGIESEDIIEAYDLHQFQIFRNFRFMEFCSYSLVEVMAFEWYELYEREKHVDQYLIKAATEVVWQANAAVLVGAPRHRLTERFGSMQRMEMEFKLMAPLYSGPDQPLGIVCTSVAELIHE